jgi:hypothetical protein
MYWRCSYRADNAALPLANRHYSLQKPETGQFVAPSRCVDLTGLRTDARWISFLLPGP